MKELEYTIQTYNQIARNYDLRYGKIKEEDFSYLDLFYDLASRYSNRPKILDAGCGTGRDLSYLERYDAELYGVDLSIGMLKIAKDKLKKTILINADIRNLPFSKNFFDGILCIAVLSHLPKRDKEYAIKEFRRVLKPGGILYISVQNLLYLPRFFRCIRYMTNRGVLYEGRYWYFPTENFMKKILNNNGFKITYKLSKPYSKNLRFYATKG